MATLITPLLAGPGCLPSEAAAQPAATVRSSAPQPSAASAFSPPVAPMLAAAQAGQPQAALNLAVTYDSGMGQPRNAPLAATWYAIAATAGLPRAAFDLGQLYQTGDGVPRNLGLARAWYSEAAAQGVSAAQDRATQLAQTADHPIDPPIMRYPALQSTVKPALNGVPLVWTVAPTPAPAEFHVQVMSLDGAAPQNVFTTTTPLSAVRMLSAKPGRYAWRVFCLCPSLGRYVASAWTEFVVG